MAIGTYYHVTPTGAGAKNGLTWATAFDEPALEAFLEATVVAGDVIFIESGTYTLDSAIDWSARDGTGIAPIALIGVTTAPRLGGREGAAILYSDWATEANRPFFDCVTFQILASDYNVIRNIYFQGSTNGTVISGGYSVIENCKFDNDNGGSG
ncbi:MAG: hypothetical protein KKD77_20345 [Gammaproteobacteria bacterium]|nr:hypothetical protein [Gammaproteobacteria bacterium]